MLLHKLFVDPALVFSKDEKEAEENRWTMRVIPMPTGFIIQSEAYRIYWQFDFTKLQHPNDVMYVVKSRSGAVKYIWQSETTQAKDGWAAALQRNNVDEFMPLVAVAIGSEKHDYCALFLTNTTQTDGEYTVLPAQMLNARSDDIFRAMFPQVADMLNKFGAKMDLLKEIRTNDALAALEAQVDLMAMWMAELIPAEFRDALLKAGVPRNKDTKVVFDDMLSFKESLRDHVATYQQKVKP